MEGQGSKAEDAAWRLATGTWLHRNGVITVTVGAKCHLARRAVAAGFIWSHLTGRATFLPLLVSGGRGFGPMTLHDVEIPQDLIAVMKEAEDLYVAA